MFNVSKVAKRDMKSPDVIRCTYFSTFETIVVDVSPHISSIKDAFYAVSFKIIPKKIVTNICA